MNEDGKQSLVAIHKTIHCLNHGLTMPRRKQLASSNTTPQKRAFSPTRATPSRQSKRTKSSPVVSAASKTTPKKSQFFSHQSSTSDAESEIENEESGYEDEDVSAVSTPIESEIDEEGEEEEEYTSEDARPQRRKAGRKSGNSVAKVTPKLAKGQELWRPGVKTDLAPGEAIFVKLPKAREAGKTPYKDDTIHPNTMLFLQDLKGNNDREWLKGAKFLLYITMIFYIICSPAAQRMMRIIASHRKIFIALLTVLLKKLLKKMKLSQNYRTKTSYGYNLVPKENDHL